MTRTALTSQLSDLKLELEESNKREVALQTKIEEIIQR